MLDDDTLIEAIRRQSGNDLPGPITWEELHQAERKLGFELPPLLRRLYTEVGNGGFGSGFLPLVTNYDLTTDTWGAWAEPESVVALYRGLRDNPPTEEELVEDVEAGQEPLREWPEMLLIICDGGCNIYSCVDCSKPEMPVLLNDNNISWSTFAVEAPSLHIWIERWLSGERLDLDWDLAEKVRYGAARPQ